MKPAGGSGHADVDGLHVYYEVHGDRGRPLVLLHGGGSTLTTSFAAVLPQLARDHRVIAVEQQAHGHTADIARPLSFEAMADDTAALLGQQGVAEADVLGFSHGGGVAIQLALRHPGLVRRLILASSFFERAGLPAELWQGFEHATLTDMPAVLRDAYLAVAPHPDALPTLFAKTVAMMRGFHDWPEQALRSIAAPTLVMVGDRDVVLAEHAARMAHLVPHAQLAVFPGSTHGAYLGVAEAGPARPYGAPGPAVAMIEAFLAD